MVDAVPILSKAGFPPQPREAIRGPPADPLILFGPPHRAGFSHRFRGELFEIVMDGIISSDKKAVRYG